METESAKRQWVTELWGRQRGALNLKTGKQEQKKNERSKTTRRSEEARSRVMKINRIFNTTGRNFSKILHQTSPVIVIAWFIRMNLLTVERYTLNTGQDWTVLRYRFIMRKKRFAQNEQDPCLMCKVALGANSISRDIGFNLVNQPVLCDLSRVYLPFSPNPSRISASPLWPSGISNGWKIDWDPKCN